VASLALLVAIIAATLAILAQRAHRGTGVSGEAGSRAGQEAVQLSQTAAHGYNPFGTGPENHDTVENVVDNDPNTTWSTERYYDGTLRKAGGTGLGLYLDAAPGVRATAVAIQTTTPGFAVQIYAADQIDLQIGYGNSTPLTQRGWQGPVGASTYVHSGERITLNLSGQSDRYYLVWMTSLPPAKESASITDITLFK
jgi:eukaryotic-like serine/threonine-protein kinase